jgi:hypothetical protein
MIIPTLKPGQHVVFYEQLYMIDHLNDSWDEYNKVFDSKDEAEQFIIKLKSYKDTCNIIGPLTLS